MLDYNNTYTFLILTLNTYKPYNKQHFENQEMYMSKLSRDYF